MSYIEEEEAPTKKSTTNPKVSVMVNSAIVALAAPKGSSLRAVNKFISENYTVDVQKLSVHIKKYLKSAVEKGEIVQTTGRGAVGSFKINKKKPEAKTKSPNIKLFKPSKMRISTPIKTLKPKKASSKDRNAKKRTDSEEDSADSTFILPNTEITTVENGEMVQPTAKDAVGSYKINKKKPAAKPKLPKIKSPKPLKIQTLSPFETLKLSSKNFPEKKTTDSEDNQADHTFIISDTEITTVQKAEIAQPTAKGSVSSYKNNKKKAQAKPKLPKIKSPKPLKMQTSSKKLLNPKKASSRKSPAKKLTNSEENPADSTFTMPITKITKKPRVSVPTKTRKSKVPLPVKVKKPKKLMAKKVKDPKLPASPKGKIEDSISSAMPENSKGAAKTAKAKRTLRSRKPTA